MEQILFLLLHDHKSHSTNLILEKGTAINESSELEVKLAKSEVEWNVNIDSKRHIGIDE